MTVVAVQSFTFKGMTFYKRVEYGVTIITTVPNPIRRRKAA